MSEPVTVTAAVTTIAAAAVSTTALTAFGVPLGLRADLLIAGFAGSLVAIVLLNTVPATGDTWLGLVRTSVRRMAVAFASSITAGYLTPLALLAANVPESLLLSMAFLVGAAAQEALGSFVRKYWDIPQDQKTGGAV